MISKKDVSQSCKNSASAAARREKVFWWRREVLRLFCGLVTTTALAVGAVNESHAQLQKLLEGATGTGDRKRLIIVFADVSGSIPQEDWAIYAQTYTNLIATLHGGDRLILGKISADSLTGFAPVVDRSLSDTGRLKRDRADHDQAGQEFKAAFDKLRSAPPAKATLILDALTLAQQLIEQDPQRQPQIVILSDMLEYSSIANFEKSMVGAKEADRLIERQKKQGLLPKLHGATIFVAGAKAPSSDKFAEVQSFWLRYFKESGAICEPGMYGRPALAFANK